MCAVIGAICFLISGFGIFYRFGFAVPILESSELVRIFTYGFARIGGALIPFSMAATGALAIRKKRKKLELEHAHICKEYQEFYPKFLKQHRNKYLFFALCETVHELQKDYPNFDFLREQFSIIYTKIGRLYHVHAGNQTEILTLLKQELRDPRFIFLIDEIKRFIKIKINLLERLRNINVENFIKQLDEDDYIDNFIFEIVGELSARKIRPSSSEFLTIVPLLEKEVSIPIRSILTRYWNDSPQRDQLIHPRDANLAEIAATTITKLFEKYPLLVCGYILTPPIPSQHFLGRQLMPEDQWTLSQSLHHAFWDQRLLSPEQFDRKLSDNLKDSLAIYNIANYVCNIIAAICFLISGFGIFYRFGFAVPTLHQSELVRIFTYSFARIGGAILPLSMATTGWLALRMKGIKLRQEHDYLCKEYREFYPKFLNQHTRKYLFFVFCEIIYELRQLRPNFNFLRLQLSIVYRKTRRFYLDPLGNEVALLASLKQELRNPSFIFLIDEIKKIMKIKINELKILTGINFDNFLQQLNENDNIDDEIFHIIGQLAIRKMRPALSELLSRVPLLEKEISSQIKTILTRYWNDSVIRDDLIHPIDVDLEELASMIITKLFARFPSLRQGSVLPLPAATLQSTSLTMYPYLGTEACVPSPQRSLLPPPRP